MAVTTTSKKQAREQKQRELLFVAASVLAKQKEEEEKARHPNLVVAIWDLDWYYAKDKTDRQNADAMRLSSYYKQSGYKVTFVTSDYDLNNTDEYTYIFIIKNFINTPNPPVRFFTNNKVKWYGRGFIGYPRFKMTATMLACRPDYLLYPNQKETKTERSDYITLFDEDRNLLLKRQNSENAYTNKYSIISDSNMWFAKSESLHKALVDLENVKNISFFEPIWIAKLLSDQTIRDDFFKLKFTSGSKMTWTDLPVSRWQEAFEFIQECRDKWPRTKIGALGLTYAIPFKESTLQWECFQNLCNVVIEAKARKIDIEVRSPTIYESAKSLLVSPQTFKELSWFTYNYLHISWIEYLCRRYQKGGYTIEELQDILSRPRLWNQEFRDLLRQTYQLKEFSLLRWGNNRLPESVIPWPLLEREFQYGL